MGARLRIFLTSEQDRSLLNLRTADVPQKVKKIRKSKVAVVTSPPSPEANSATARNSKVVSRNSQGTCSGGACPGVPPGRKRRRVPRPSMRGIHFRAQDSPERNVPLRHVFRNEFGTLSAVSRRSPVRLGGEIDLKYLDESGFCLWSEPSLKATLKPGDKLIILDLIKPESLPDLLSDMIAVPLNWIFQLLKNRHIKTSPEAIQAIREHSRTDEYLTRSQAQQIYARLLSKTVVKQHLFWRYSLVWEKIVAC